MQYLDISRMHDMLSRFFNVELKKYIPESQSFVSQSEDRTAQAQVRFESFENESIEEYLSKITLATANYMKIYIVDILELDLSEVNRNVVFYESEINNDIIFFRWAF